MDGAEERTERKFYNDGLVIGKTPGKPAGVQGPGETAGWGEAGDWQTAGGEGHGRRGGREGEG
ncbi:hypothetical protein E2C01_065559 [Portunus trituberculatus]|uniref:Uncharacterized protein n=1 Tax=Portunus trituberculatus TaxID=210409 RepID=A0A5B7HPX9_PORTR|nr:hypothetical protein [Portunus trituberculatus]